MGYQILSGTSKYPIKSIKRYKNPYGKENYYRVEQVGLTGALMFALNPANSYGIINQIADELHLDIMIRCD